MFSGHKESEEFLHQMTSLLVASHYRNSPDDLQVLSDAPAHRIFVLMPPMDKNASSIPTVLCVIQVTHVLASNLNLPLYSLGGWSLKLYA